MWLCDQITFLLQWHSLITINITENSWLKSNLRVVVLLRYLTLDKSETQLTNKSACQIVLKFQAITCQKLWRIHHEPIRLRQFLNFWSETTYWLKYDSSVTHTHTHTQNSFGFFTITKLVILVCEESWKNAKIRMQLIVNLFVYCGHDFFIYSASGISGIKHQTKNVLSSKCLNVNA